MLSRRATRGLELTLFVGLVLPLLVEWFETTSASSRLSYALLVPALALVLALRAGRVPAPPGERAASRTAWCWPALAALALLAGSLSGVFTLSLLALPLAAVGYVARFGGPGALRRCAPALAFSFLMVPPPMPLLDRLNPLLTRASGATAVALLGPFDPDATWAGATLGFRGWTLIVAEACSGSGTFLMLGALGAFLAALFRLRPAVWLALALLTLPLTLLVNGVRIASSALVIDRWGAAAGEGLAHELLGQVVVVAGAALLALAVDRWAARGTPVRA